MPLLRSLAFGFLVSLLPVASTADVIELSQTQLRQLVQDQQIHGAEAIVDAALATFDGTPLEIRGFLTDGSMTYRLLIQRADGSVIEVLMDGQTAERVSQDTEVGQAVAQKARDVLRVQSLQSGAMLTDDASQAAATMLKSTMNPSLLK